ncbi:MAG: MFS transporter [Halanaerobiales bacterium]
MNNKQPKIRFKNLIAYGIGDIYGGGAFLVLGTLYLYFLTDIVGLPPGKAGLVLIIGKVWDAISDPLMGHISDNTNTRLGRRRIYFLLGIIPVALSFSLLWYPGSFSSLNMTFIYYLIAYIFFSTIFTMVMVPYTALNAEMTEDYQERTKLSTYRMFFSQISALIAGSLPRLMVNFFANINKFSHLEGQKLGFFVMGIVFGVLYSLPWIIVYKGTWELQSIPSQSDKNIVDKIKSYKTVFYNKSFRIQLAMYIAAYVAMDFLMALFVYFLDYYLQKPGLFPYSMFAILASQIIMLPFYLKLSNKKGKAYAYIIGLTIWGAGMLSLLLLSTSTPAWLILFVCAVIGSGLSAGVMIPWAILPSITDVDEVITLKKRTGIYSGLMTLFRKMAQAIAMWSVGFILSIIGYTPNQPQNPETLMYLKLLFVLIPIILILIGIYAALKFKITPEKHQKLIEEIERLRKGGKKRNVEKRTKELCEELSGISYFS